MAQEVVGYICGVCQQSFPLDEIENGKIPEHSSPTGISERTRCDGSDRPGNELTKEMTQAKNDKILPIKIRRSD